jgi:hypothetical protein
MSGPYELPHYDPKFCGKVLKWAAAVCVMVLIFELLVLVIIDPSDSRCPGWIINAGKASATPWWHLIAFMTGLPTAWICYVVWRWPHFSQKLYDSIAYGHPSLFSRLFGSGSRNSREPPDLNFESIFMIDSNWVIVAVSIGWCLCATLPFWMMLASCTDLPVPIRAG